MNRRFRIPIVSRAACWLAPLAGALSVLLTAGGAPAQEQAVAAGFPNPSAPGVSSVSTPAVPVLVPPGFPLPGNNVRAAGGPNTGTQAEISMASSGSNVVITFNGGPQGGAGFVTSNDGGATFSQNASFPAPAGATPAGDPALVAGPGDKFYFVQIFFNDGAGNCTNSIELSNDGGQTFSNIIGSPFSYASGTTDFPDMPHMGVDRINLVAGQPQLYVQTRHFTSGINCPATG